MKIIVYFSVFLLLACCKKMPVSGNLEAHVKSNQPEIHRIVETFELSGYKKITFGSPDFLTLIDSDGKILEIEVDKIRRDRRPEERNSEFEMEVLGFIESFEDTGIQSLEKSNGVYIGFSDGSLLITAEDDSDEVARLLHGKPSVEIYKGWYLFFE